MPKKKKVISNPVKEPLVLCNGCKTNMIREDDGLCQDCFWKVFNDIAFGTDPKPEL